MDGDEPPGDLRLLHDDLIKEYFALSDLVTSFDQRLLTIKGWGVTLSLASLAGGFQQDHYGLFLVAAVSGVAFWVVEGATKFHQKRYYPRMGDIEVAMFELFQAHTPSGRPVSSPLLDWGWFTAARRLHGGADKGRASDTPQRWPEDNPLSRLGRVRYTPLWYPHVVLPHLIAVVVGGALFMIGLLGYLGPI